MRQFNTPPGWPDPPTARWRPPRRWRPPATWPKPPRGWAFWVDENGRGVRGPIGRYGGPGIVMTAAIIVIPLVLMSVVIVNPFRSGDSVSTVPTIATSSTRPKAHPATSSTTTQRTDTPSPTTEQPTTGTPTVTPTTSTLGPGTTSTTPSSPVVPLTAAPPPDSTAAPQTTPTPTTTTTPPSAKTVVFRNCDEARAAGKAPLHRGDPGYSAALDHNGDGVACGDRGNS